MATPKEEPAPTPASAGKVRRKPGRPRKQSTKSEADISVDSAAPPTGEKLHMLLSLLKIYSAVTIVWRYFKVQLYEMILTSDGATYYIELLSLSDGSGLCCEPV